MTEFTPNEILAELRHARPRPYIVSVVRIADLLNGGSGGRRMVSSSLIPRHRLHNLLHHMIEGPPTIARDNQQVIRLAKGAKADLEKALAKLDRMVKVKPDINPQLDARQLVKHASDVMSTIASGYSGVLRIGDPDVPLPAHVPVPERKGTTGRRPRPRDADPAMRHCFGVLSRYYSDRTAYELTGLLLYALRIAHDGSRKPLAYDAVKQRLTRP